MNRNYPTPTPKPNWASARGTHIAVATAIHAISGSARTADEIWEAPTAAEWDHVTMAVEEYTRHGDFPAEPDGRYPWGEENITVAPT